jgi:hypothetical protein
VSRGWAAAFIGFAALIALTAVEVAAARPALLPSPTAPLDSRIPVGGPIPREPFLLPRSGQVVNRERVVADVLHDGTVVRIGVIQRLTLTGTGDFSFQIPAPLLDVKAAPGSQGEPGLRPTAIIWQGFANRRRVLAADARLVPRTAAPALPLRLELRATVDGRSLVQGERESGRLRISLRLRNATAVRALTFAAAARPGAVRRVLERIAAQAEETPSQPSVDVRGPISGRQVVVDAPFVVSGEVRLPVSALTAAVARGGTVVSRRGQAVLRFRRVLGGPAAAAAAISLSGRVRGAGSPEAVLTARPVPLVPEAEQPPRNATGAQLVLLAGRSLLRLARAHQYQAFLATPGGSTRTLYSFRTVTAASTSSSAPGGNGDENVVLLILLATGAVVVAVGLVVLWAHL